MFEGGAQLGDAAVEFTARRLGGLWHADITGDWSVVSALAARPGDANSTPVPQATLSFLQRQSRGAAGDATTYGGRGRAGASSSGASRTAAGGGSNSGTYTGGTSQQNWRPYEGHSGAAPQPRASPGSSSSRGASPEPRGQPTGPSSSSSSSPSANSKSTRGQSASRSGGAGNA
jgi:hypothetical protein